MTSGAGATWRTKLEEATAGLFERTRQLPAEPWKVPLVRALAFVSNELSGSAPDRQALAAAIATAVREALALEAAGLVGPDLIARMAPAVNALLSESAPEPARSAVDRRATSASLEPLLKGSRGVPRALVIHLDEEAGGAGEAQPAAAEPADAAIPEAERDPPPPPRWTEDPERFDPDAPAPPRVRLDEGGDPRPLRDFYAGVADRALRSIAMLARHRTERRMTEWTEEEDRILAAVDALAATGGECAARTSAWWEASLESPDPWKTWAPCFALGAIEGAESPRRIADGLRALPAAATRHAELAAEALVGSPHPALIALIQDLRRDAHPIARAVGVDLASKLGALSPEEIAAHLADPNPAVTLASIRASIRCDPPAPELHAPLLLWMHHDDRAIAYSAARALHLLGRTEPLDALRRRGPLVARLGALGVVELLVLAGEAEDLALVQSLLGKTKPSPALLSGVARLGHAGTWALLTHFLGEPDFAEAAADALFTLFGERVPRRTRLNASAWRDAIGAARFDPEKRLRRGEPWTPAVVAAECTSSIALLSRNEVEKRLDELAVRTGIPARVDMSRWSPIAAPALAAYLARMNQVSRGWPPGTWAYRVT